MASEISRPLCSNCRDAETAPFSPLCRDCQQAELTPAATAPASTDSRGRTIPMTVRLYCHHDGRDVDAQRIANHTDAALDEYRCLTCDAWIICAECRTLWTIAHQESH